MNFEKRIRALEANRLSKPVILRFSDGSTRELRGPHDFLLTLFLGSIGRHLSAAQAEQLDLIKESISAEEPAGGHMIELIRALIDSPTEEIGSD